MGQQSDTLALPVEADGEALISWPTVVNAVLFQAAWFAVVLGAAAGWPLVGVLGVVLLLGFSHWAGQLMSDLRLLVWLVPLGFALDSIWAATGVLEFVRDGAAGEAVMSAPLWIALLWVAVGLTLNHSLGWMLRYPLIGALLAACSAPLCYLAGERFGAVTVPAPTLLAFISVAWFTVFYLQSRLRQPVPTTALSTTAAG